MGAKCFWDSDTDNMAQDVFMNVRVAVGSAVFWPTAVVSCVCFYLTLRLVG